MEYVKEIERETEVRCKEEEKTRDEVGLNYKERIITYTLSGATSHHATHNNSFQASTSPSQHVNYKGKTVRKLWNGIYKKSLIYR